MLSGSMLGRTQDALILRYKSILRGTNLDRIQAQLSHFYAAELSLNTDEYMATLVQSHLNVVGTMTAPKLRMGSTCLWSLTFGFFIHRNSQSAPPSREIPTSNNREISVRDAYPETP